MVEKMADDNARVDFGILGWSPEFSAWYDEIDEEIQNELEAWND
jgi:predicted nucleotidyltransferase